MSRGWRRAVRPGPRGWSWGRGCAAWSPHAGGARRGEPGELGLSRRGIPLQAGSLRRIKAPLRQGGELHPAPHPSR